MDLIEFDDVEDRARLYLAATLPARPGMTGVVVIAPPAPTDWPTRSVFVRRTGGTSRDLVTDLAQVTVECRASTAAKALAVAAAARTLLTALDRSGDMAGTPVHEVLEFTAPYLDPDPNNPGLTRYSATYQLAVRGRATAA